MKVFVDSDEWYPVHSIDDQRYGTEVELTPEEIQRIQAAVREFNACQAILSAALAIAKEKRRVS